MKICSNCKIKKEFSEFHKASSAKDGYNYYCKLCNNLHAKKYKENHPDRVKDTSKRFRETNVEYFMLRSAKLRAKQHNLPFNLDIEDIEIPEFCPYLKIKLDKTKGNGRKDSAPSLDKIIPELGYVKGNIEVISDKANRMKSNANPRELIEFALAILDKVPNEKYNRL
jgi:hypothetical protein